MTWYSPLSVPSRLGGHHPSLLHLGKRQRRRRGAVPRRPPPAHCVCTSVLGKDLARAALMEVYDGWLCIGEAGWEGLGVGYVWCCSSFWMCVCETFLARGRAPIGRAGGRGERERDRCEPHGDRQTASNNTGTGPDRVGDLPRIVHAR